jgi:hypothetical protein
MDGDVKLNSLDNADDALLAPLDNFVERPENDFEAEVAEVCQCVTE